MELFAATAYRYCARTHWKTAMILPIIPLADAGPKQQQTIIRPKSDKVMDVGSGRLLKAKSTISVWPGFDDGTKVKIITPGRSIEIFAIVFGKSTENAPATVAGTESVAEPPGGRKGAVKILLSVVAAPTKVAVWLTPPIVIVPRAPLA